MNGRPDPAARRIWLTRLTGAAALLLMGVTWPLWLPPTPDNFPQLPLFARLIPAPAWCDLAALAGAAVGAAGMCWGNLKTQETRDKDGEGRGVVSCLLSLGIFFLRAAPALFAASLAFALALNQIRVQVWAYQFLLLAAVLALCPRSPAGDRAAVTLARVLAVGILFHSALSKLDLAFAEGPGRWLMGGFLGLFGLDAGELPGRAVAAAAFAVPAWELALAMLLAVPGLRRAGLAGAVVMHLGLVATLWRLDQSWGVILWNLFFLAHEFVLFWPEPRGERLPAWTKLRSAGWRAWPAALLILAAVTLPFGTRAGYWDVWPGWAVYAGGRAAGLCDPHDDGGGNCRARPGRNLAVRPPNPGGLRSPGAGRIAGAGPAGSAGPGRFAVVRHEAGRDSGGDGDRPSARPPMVDPPRASHRASGRGTDQDLCRHVPPQRPPPGVEPAAGCAMTVARSRRRAVGLGGGREHVPSSHPTSDIPLPTSRMPRVNDHFSNLKAGYLFPEIGRRVRAFQDENPGKSLIKLGIGDVTEPLPAAVRGAMHAAVDELGVRETFRGYGPEKGYPFLREAIAEHDFAGLGVSPDEIYISDGSKCDCGNMLDILAGEGANKIAVADPVYPVYVDTNVMAGNAGPAGDDGRYSGLIYLEATAENDFQPAIPEEKADVVYLCYPNNPTGAVASREYLTEWVNYARRHGSLLLFDAAYAAFVTDTEIPRSIYEIDGAETCAVEFRSFSKNAGFTGVRCAFTVVPAGVTGTAADGSEIPLAKLWDRRQSTKFNGVSYVVQRGAAAVYTDEGQRQTGELVDFYMENARLIREGLEDSGVEVHGGANAPYVWLKTPGTGDSWAFFDRLLTDAGVVGTPGAGFGAAGEGYFRLSAFNSRENVEAALGRIRGAL